MWHPTRYDISIEKKVCDNYKLKFKCLSMMYYYSSPLDMMSVQNKQPVSINLLF